MKIEAITISINFSDYLIQCVGNNKLLDRWLIVTEESDLKTIDVCKQFDIEYMFTKRIHENGAPFAKGKAINEGLERLKKDDWILHLDSDILLPGKFKRYMDDAVLDKNVLYTTKRYLTNGEKMPGSSYALGYFQLWHSSKKTKYPERHDSARWDDVDHRKSFKDRKAGKRNLALLGLKCIDVSGIIDAYHYGRPVEN